MLPWQVPVITYVAAWTPGAAPGSLPLAAAAQTAVWRFTVNKRQNDKLPGASQGFLAGKAACPSGVRKRALGLASAPWRGRGQLSWGGRVGASLHQRERAMYQKTPHLPKVHSKT